MENNECWVYILLCSNGCLYTGFTLNMKRRYQEHQQGTAKSKYTRSFKPVKIAQCWKVYSGKSLGMKVEHFIKRLVKKDKEGLIRYPEKLTEIFSVVQPCSENDLIGFMI